VNPEIKDLLYKYITRNPDIHPEDAPSSGATLVTSYALQAAEFTCWILSRGRLAHHGGHRYHDQYDIESRKKMVKKLAGIPERSKKP